MIRLSKTQLDGKLDFIKNYIQASNAASGSKFDPNSNVTSKNIATLMSELNKDINIQIRRRIIYEELKELYPEESVADDFIYQLDNHEIYCHDESALLPYCAAVSLYPFLLNGLQDFGGESKAPQHLTSFNGGFVNAVFALSSQFNGAIATVEYLTYFDYFARKDYGNDYLHKKKKIIQQELQQVVYALNQPAAARGFQAVFWNISIFDEYYFNGIFKNFVFPDGTKPNWETVNKLQQFFMQWFNKERTKALLTFPVVTVALLHDDSGYLDKEYRNFTAKELSEGNSFFIYTSKSVDSLSSCCRLKNDITDQINDFSYSLGAGGVMTGSLNVITLNINRFIQKHVNKHTPIASLSILKLLKDQIKLIHKYQLGFKSFFKKLQDNGMLPAYTGHFIEIDKQFLTIGINGLIEAVEYLGYNPSNNAEYKIEISEILQTISETNKETMSQHPKLKLNTEIVPAEGLGTKFAKWDKKDGLVVPRDCYNSYFYPVEDNNISIIDKFILHGNEITQYLDGGSALHLNLDNIPTESTARKIMLLAIKTGCPYFCINVKSTICNDCGFINKKTVCKCIKCGSTNIDYATRIIGYLRKITNFSGERQIEESKRYYHIEDKTC